MAKIIEFDLVVANQLAIYILLWTVAKLKFQLLREHSLIFGCSHYFFYRCICICMVKFYVWCPAKRQVRN